MALIREAEVDQKVGEVMPVAEALAWLRHIYIPFVNSVRALPDEMRDLSTPDLASLLRRRIEGIINRSLGSTSGRQSVPPRGLICSGHIGPRISSGSRI